MTFVSEDDWILLEYESGEAFHSHCGNEGKRTMVMIMCKRGETTVFSLLISMTVYVKEWPTVYEQLSFVR